MIGSRSTSPEHREEAWDHVVGDAPRVSIFIPTYNRSLMVAEAVESALAQNHEDFQIVVVDDGSTDDTAATVASFRDPHLKYVRNNKNLGLFRNWVRALDLNPSPYVSILPDDDAYLPGFINRSVEVLDRYPDAAFSSTLARRIDGNDRPLASQEPRGATDCIEGLEYLHQIVSGRHWVIQPATVMMRAAAVQAVGGFDPVHSATSFDFNLYIRLGARFDVAFLDEELARVRVHEETVSHQAFNVVGATGPLTTLAELMDAGLFLLRSERAADEEYRRWLSRRLMSISLLRSQITAELIPGLNLAWDERVQVAIDHIAGLVAHESSFVLIDAGELGLREVAGCRALPLLERNGSYWGPPPDDEAAIRALEQVGAQAGTTVVVAWPAFEWLDWYPGLARYLEDRYARVAANSLIVAFRARDTSQPVYP